MTDTSGQRTYVDTYRRALLDMHIPDWDPAFLSKYDPEELADRYAAAGVEGVLLYCKSHLGLNYWPTPVGAVHSAARGRDLVGELIAALRERNLRPAAYHSVIFDNWAVETHPQWRQVSVLTEPGLPTYPSMGTTYGVACPNHPDYVAYEVAQITALLERYDVDALWVDMVFWPTYCVCAHCQRRAADELDLAEIPTVIDWDSPTFVAFHEARTRWLNEFWSTLRTAARAVRPGIPVAHNLAPQMIGWSNAAMTDEVVRDSFAAGDLYGGRDEQLIVSRLMHSLSTEAPGEYMTSRAQNLKNHTEIRSEHELLLHALGATAQHLAFLFIDAINPDGTTEPGVYERIRRVYAATRQYERHLGGTPVSDVAVYFSPRSRMQGSDNGKALSDTTRTAPGDTDYERAFRGACAALQSAHIPFAVVTPSTRDKLHGHQVLILPDVTRLSPDETSDLRDFVRNGGRLYASGATFASDATGARSDGLGLADVLGAHLDGRYETDTAYLQPAADLVAAAIAPERVLCWGPNLDWAVRGTRQPNVHFLGDLAADAQVLATFNLPYAYPEVGTVENHKFSSIHSQTPWTDSGRPAVVRHPFGTGLAIYSAVPAEAAVSDSSKALFVSLVRSLVDRPRVVCEAPSQVWITLFDQLERGRMILSVLNYSPDREPGVLARVSIRVHAPDGYVIVGATFSDGGAIAHELADDGHGLLLSDFVVEVFAQIAINLTPGVGRGLTSSSRDVLDRRV